MLSRGPWFGLGCPSDFETTHVASLQKVDVTSKAVVEVLARTIEYLQPNPGRAPAGCTFFRLLQHEEGT